MASTYDGHLGDPVLLAKMDKLREKGISEYIPLPQLVVVGDQSSGKSSVLEGLTELPFPRDSTLCTRFATHIVFRRAEKESVSVSIIPSPSSDTARVDKLKRFKNDGLKAFSAEDFKLMLEKASDEMGIPAPGCARADGQSTFSDDVFRIELCGPTKSHLSVIDVPGIFRTTTEGLTIEEDKMLVQRMVRRYIENPRTIILAVLAANVDIATTEILDMAAKVDPSGQRTLGILTKPDLVEKGAEQDIIDLVRAERHRVESEFFKTDPWSSLDKDRVGISTLSPRLRDLLGRITRREFPTVVREINNRLLTCEEELRDLGPSRQTPEQQRRYLLGIATRFQEVTTYALEAQYGRHQFLKDDKDLRLATLVIDFNSVFSEDLEKRGHAVNFDEIKHTTGKRSRKSKPVRSPKLKLKESPVKLFTFTNKEPAKGRDTTTTDHLDYPELTNILPNISNSIPPPLDNIMEWIEREYKSSRGFELGTFNPSILPTLFQELSKKWQNIAGTYVSNVIVSIHRFCHIVLARLCTEERVMNALWSLLMDGLLQRYRRTVEHVRFILKTECSGNLLTTNHYFSETLDKLRAERITEQEGGFSLGTAKAAAYGTNASNMEHTVKDIHDILKSYYKVARKRFADNVCMQGTDYHLITGPETPLRLLSSEFVVDLSAEQLESIAGEDTTSIRRRKTIEKEIESLTEGRMILTT